MADTPSRLSAALADRYRLMRELGQGGMATVYLAEDPKHGRQVAVKVLRPELAQALGPDRFLREIEIAARLNHPNILTLIDSGDADGFLYFVMPYVDALAHAHRHGVVHRDVKPDNVILTEGHAVVTAKALSAATGRHEVTTAANHDSQTVGAGGQRLARFMVVADLATFNRDEDIWGVPLGGGQPELLAGGPGIEFGGEFLPDGQLYA